MTFVTTSCRNLNGGFFRSFCVSGGRLITWPRVSMVAVTAASNAASSAMVLTHPHTLVLVQAHTPMARSLLLLSLLCTLSLSLSLLCTLLSLFSLVCFCFAEGCQRLLSLVVPQTARIINHARLVMGEFFVAFFFFVVFFFFFLGRVGFNLSCCWSRTHNKNNNKLKP